MRVYIKYFMLVVFLCSSFLSRAQQNVTYNQPPHAGLYQRAGIDTPVKQKVVIAKKTIPKSQKLIFQENFDHSLDTSLWHVEIEQSPNSFVKADRGKLTLKTGAGVTVWLKIKLRQNIKISYDRVIIDKGGAQDRLSDLNQFWMASDPLKLNLFTRNGQLDEYNNLQLYYVGMGGNTNTTTRFRKYDGKGNRELLAEYSDGGHLLQSNKRYHIDLMVNNGEVSFWVDGKQYFSYLDRNVLKEGYFGFRSTKSNQEIYDLKIYQLP